MKNKNVFITGGSRGIGKATVYELSQRGCNICFTYLKNEQLANNTINTLISQFPNQKFKAIKCDVSNYDSCQKAIKIVQEFFEDCIDILINNAGIINDSVLYMMSSEKWEEVINTNINSLYNITQPLIFDFLKKKNGVIVNVSSVAGVYGNIGQTNYSTTKAGIIGFTKSLSKEVGNQGIRVNAVAPGFIETDMAQTIDNQKLKEFTKNISLKRAGKVEEVAKVIAFLCSEDSSYITGQTLIIDGGLSI